MSDETYSLSGYGSMIADKIRIDAFTRALRGAIRPGAVVMDIGTGPGVMAVLACQLGAGRVYAIEPSSVIQLAREIAAANQCADKIEFFEDFSTKVTIPAKADIILSDMRGVLPLFQSHIPSIADARQRFLTPGGTLIARRDKIWAAVVEAPKQHDNIVGSWDRNALGQNLSLARRKVLNEFQKVRMSPEDLLTAPALWATLDYSTIEDPDVRGTLQWAARRSGTGHGLLVWFDMELADGVGFSNGPESPEAIYSSAFFPWSEPVPLIAGQDLCVELEAKLLDNDYFWRWTTQIASPEKAGEIAVRFEQSQLQGAILSPAKLHKSASDFVPQLSAEGLLRRRTLELMDGQVTLEGIARQLATEFPQRFSHWHKALSYAGAISQEHSW
jgi:protein arginine N-methyltransferase 1